jgi:hypothetical protein
VILVLDCGNDVLDDFLMVEMVIDGFSVVVRVIDVF